MDSGTIDEWTDGKTGVRLRLGTFARPASTVGLMVGGAILSSADSFDFLARRIEQLKQHKPVADGGMHCTCGALERNDPQAAHPGRHSHDCPYRQNYRPSGQREEYQMPTLNFTEQHHDHEERLQMPAGAIRLTGKITVPEGLETGKTYRLFGLAIAEEYDEKTLAREWEVWEIGLRNGKLVVESHGFGPKKARQRGLPEPLKTQLVGPVVEFEVLFDGEGLELNLHQDETGHDVDTFIKPEEGEELVLYFGAPAGLEIQPPIGFEITYEIELS